MKFSMAATAISMLVSNYAFASFYEKCEFDADVVTMTSINKLDDGVSYDDMKEALVLKITAAAKTAGHTSCTGHIGEIKVLELTEAQVKKYANTKTLKLSYTHVNGLTPDGVKGEIRWQIIEQPELFDGGAMIKSASFDAKTSEIVLQVTHGGGCGEHFYSLAMQACMESFPVQCSAILVHKTNDPCEALLSREVRISLKDAGITESYYSRGSLVIRGANKSEAAITLPEIK